MRVVFFGTPEIAVPALDALQSVAQVVGVVCPPDRPTGRGLRSSPCAVKRRAHELGIQVFQPERVRDGGLQTWLAALNLDAALVLAFGRILPQAVLDTPKQGCLNLHASLLPKHRGAAPIAHAILAGDDCTGVSLMQMTAGLDEGPVYTSRSVAIDSSCTAGTLGQRLAGLAADIVSEDLVPVLNGEVPSTEQDPSRATWAPPLTAEDELLKFEQDAISLERRVRALAPRPGASSSLRGRRLKVLAAKAEAIDLALPPGAVKVGDGRRVLVATGSGALELLEVQLAGKRAISARDLLNGRSISPGDFLVPSPGASP